MYAYSHTHGLVRTYVSTYPLLVAATQLIEIGRALVALVIDEVIVVVEGLRALVAGGPRADQVHLALVTRQQLLVGEALVALLATHRVLQRDVTQ